MLTGHPHILGWLLLTVLIIGALGRGLGFATCDPYTFHARRHLINRVPRGIRLLSLGLRKQLVQRQAIAQTRKTHILMAKEYPHYLS